MNLLLHIKSLIAFQIIMLSKEARLLLKKDKEKKKDKSNTLYDCICIQ